MPSRRRRRRASPEWEGRPTITVAALPGRGLYARHLGHPEGVDGVHRMTVPTVGTAGNGTGRRPGTSASPGFDSAWLRDHLDDVDVVHVHGLPPAADPSHLDDAVGVVRDAGRPLVVTAYHLSDPTGSAPDRYDAALDVLVPAADAVITLTPSAADEIRTRWGLEARVLPHPHAVDFVRMRRHRPAPRGRLVVGAHLGALRGPVPGEVMARALAEACAQVDGTHLVVQVNAQVLDSGSTSWAPDAIRAVHAAVASVGGTVRMGRPFSEPQLWDHLFGIDVSVVPGLHGSHSIWPEACYDLGTQIVLPSGSHAEQQQQCHTYDLAPHGPDAATLAVALKAAREAAQDHEQRDRRAPTLDQGPADGPEACAHESAHESTDEPGSPDLAPAPLPWRADPQQRWQERVTLAESLRRVYEQLTGVGVR